jgi:hypothetical protein
VKSTDEAEDIKEAEEISMRRFKSFKKRVLDKTKEVREVEDNDKKVEEVERKNVMRSKCLR